MEIKKAIEVLVKMLEKYKLEAEEKEAVLAAVGILDWARLGQGRAKRIMKNKKDREKKIE